MYNIILCLTFLLIIYGAHKRLRIIIYTRQPANTSNMTKKAARRRTRAHKGVLLPPQSPHNPLTMRCIPAPLGRLLKKRLPDFYGIILIRNHL